MEAIRLHSSINLSAISLIEVSRKAAAGELALGAPLKQWITEATVPGIINTLCISIPIAVDAYSLPGDFHKDPADRIIVATARVHQMIIITSDRKILDYPHVHTLSSR